MKNKKTLNGLAKETGVSYRTIDKHKHGLIRDGIISKDMNQESDWIALEEEIRQVVAKKKEAKQTDMIHKKKETVAVKEAAPFEENVSSHTKRLNEVRERYSFVLNEIRKHEKMISEDNCSSNQRKEYHTFLKEYILLQKTINDIEEKLNFSATSEDELRSIFYDALNNPFDDVEIVSSVQKYSDKGFEYFMDNIPNAYALLKNYKKKYL